MAAALLVNLGAWRCAGAGEGSGGIRPGRLLDRHSRSRWISNGFGRRLPYNIYGVGVEPRMGIVRVYMHEYIIEQ